MAFPLLLLLVQWSSACRCRYPVGVGSVRDGAGAAGPAWAAPGALLAGHGPVVVLAACCPPGGLLWALWAVLVPWCLPSSVQVVRGCVAVSAAVWWSAVLLSMLCRLGGCCGLLLIVGALAGLCAVVLPWSSGAGAACVLPLLPWIAAGAASLRAVGACFRSVSSPTA